MGDNNGYILLFIALLHMATRVAFSMREYYAGGRSSQSSEARRPSPCTPTLLGTETSVTSSMCNTVDSCLYSSVFRM